MFVLQCNRKEFTDFVLKRVPIREGVLEVKSDYRVPKSSKELSLLWRESPNVSFSLPNVVVIDGKKQKDFIAWVSTYFPHIRPFTSQCRIVAEQTARTLLSSAQSENEFVETRTAQTALIIAEAVCYSVGHVSLSQLPFSAFERTLSYSLSQGMRSYNRSTEVDWCTRICSLWQQFRDLSKQKKLALTPEDVGAVWRVLTNLKSPSKTRELEEVFTMHWREQTLTEDLWESLFELLNLKLGKDVVVALTSGPRETRVEIANALIQGLATDSKGASPQTVSFALALITSQINPGNLDYFELLHPVVERFPQAFLWYGLLTGIVPKSDSNSFSDGLGWLIERELGRHYTLLDRPHCDVALTELNVCYDLENSYFGVSNLTTGIMKVEIFPLVNSSIRLNMASQSNQFSDHQQKKLFDEKQASLSDSMIREFLQKLEENSLHLDSIKATIEREFGKTKKKSKAKKKKSR